MLDEAALRDLSPVGLEYAADRILEAAGYDAESPSEAPETPKPVLRWEWVSPALRGAAEAVCTERQLEAVRLRYEGLDTVETGERMRVSKQRASALFEAGAKRIEAHLSLGVDDRTHKGEGAIREG
jgi:predicted DNA-binding protein (UPF0251 family)